MKRWLTAVRLAGIAIGAVGLAFAYPPFDNTSNSWFALVPLLWIVRTSSPRVAARWAAGFGMVFWPIVLSWFPAIVPNGGPAALVIAGMLGLSIVCSLYMAAFAYCSALVWSRARGSARLAAVSVCDPLLWAFFEWIRGNLFSGFAWNFLGVAQVGNLPVIQFASVAGVYGVSMVLMLVNGALTGLAMRMSASFVRRLPGFAPPVECSSGVRVKFGPPLESALPLGLAVAAWVWGAGELRQGEKADDAAKPLRAAIIQPNIPCVFMHHQDISQLVSDRTVGQTRMAALAKPDLVLWPECAVLGSLPDGTFAKSVVASGVEASGGAVLLTGATEKSRVGDGGVLWFNSAFAFNASGETIGSYRKRHLVPFGEYIPLDKTITWLQRFAPTGESCTPGTDARPIKLPGERNAVLGALICFEDTVPWLSRDAVRAGANVLALMTNDAWFNGSCEASQHQRQAVFRAVENRVPMIRSANSGVSCFVDAYGRVKKLEAEGRESDFHGFLLGEVVPGDGRLSFYTRYGDWPMIGCALMVLAVAASVEFKRRRA